jgi:hypothetical protein
LYKSLAASWRAAMASLRYWSDLPIDTSVSRCDKL